MTATADKLEFPRSSLRSEAKVRALNAEALGLPFARPSVPAEDTLPCEIEDDDNRLQQVRRLLNDGYAGVVLSGPPGTSKTWYAKQIAAKLVDLDKRRVRFVQFHASYQYEDFIEGYVPREEGDGFNLVEKHFLNMCNTAKEAEGKLCVLVIDELSRCDPARVFGEALTYLEMPMRNQPFHLASGKRVAIPTNLVFLATMNPFDRGVDEVDVALERRFAKISMEPDVGILRKLLTQNGAPEDLQNRIARFMESLQSNENPLCRLGHAYFRSVADEDSLQRLWEHQLQFFFEKTFRLDPEGLRSVQRFWKQLFGRAGDGKSEAEKSSPAE